MEQTSCCSGWWCGLVWRTRRGVDSSGVDSREPRRQFKQQRGRARHRSAHHPAALLPQELPTLSACRSFSPLCATTSVSAATRSRMLACTSASRVVTWCQAGGRGGGRQGEAGWLARVVLEQGHGTAACLPAAGARGGRAVQPCLLPSLHSASPHQPSQPSPGPSPPHPLKHLCGDAAVPRVVVGDGVVGHAQLIQQHLLGWREGKGAV